MNQAPRDPLAAAMAAQGQTLDDISKHSKLGKVFYQRGVPNSAELQRVLDMPTYVWQEDETLEELRLQLTDWLKTPHGTQELRTIQAAALASMHDFGGLFGLIRVGGGKTLMSYLAGTVCEADRVLLLVPAKLRDKTLREFEALEKNWRAHPSLRVMSYELLSRDRGPRELQEYMPDLIIADEAQKLKNPKAACTRRLRRYLSAMREHARYVDLSGTPTKRSILEYHHRAKWALPPALQPLPRTYPEARDWADAIDEKVEVRLAPNALLQLCSDEEIANLGKDPLSAVRVAYRRRLVSTPGVIGTSEMFDGAMSIVMTCTEIKLAPAVHDAFRLLRDSWETPDGQPCSSPADIWRHARELACGFYYRWDPPAPAEWMYARREWSRFVREELKHSRKLDTELQVARVFPDSEELRRWRTVRDTFKPNSVPVWLDTATLDHCAAWLSRNRGICWVEHVAFGRELSARTGLPYFGQGGLDANKRPIEDCTGPCIASIAANSEGRNLQHYSANLTVSVPPGGAVWEQKLGRTHRDGQTADEITDDVLLSCFEQWESFKQSLADARYIEDTTGQAQKLLYADIIDLQTPVEVNERTDAPWDKSSEFWIDKA